LSNGSESLDFLDGFPLISVSTLFIGMNPFVRRNLPLLGQLDHADRRLVAAGAAGPASERWLYLCRPLPERLSIPTLKPPAGDVMQRRIEHATTAIIKERKSQLKLTMAGACSK